MEKHTFAPTQPVAETERSKAEKLELLRVAIKRAEAAEDEAKVLLLEAELKAVEADQIFDPALHQSKKNPIRKSEVLRSIQSISDPEKDTWTFDGVYRETDDRNYDAHFKEFLAKLGHKSFADYAHARSSELGRPITALDLFGGAYFLSDLTDVSHIVGARLRNRDEDFDSEKVRELENDSRRTVVEGNLYEGKTWKALREDAESNTTDGYDVIVCRPQGPFGVTPGISVSTIREVKQERDSRYKQEIYIALLERTLKLLSTEGGTLFLQIPVLYTREDEEKKFWEKYQQENPDYEFTFGTYNYNIGDNVMIRRKNSRKDAGEL